MISVRTVVCCIVTFLSLKPALFSQTVLVRDIFSYPDVASFNAEWQTLNGVASFTPGSFNLVLGNALVSRDFGPSQFIRPCQSWNLTCGISQTSFERGQWFGLFTEDMCHGYVVRWDSSVARNYGGDGSYSIYKYDSATPLSTWNTALGAPVASCGGNQPALMTTPVNLKMSSTYNSATQMRQITVNVPNATGAATTLQAQVPDSDQRVYTRVVLSGNSAGLFSDVVLTSANAGFNVVSYGATGDGATDDTAAINKAIAAAEAAGGSVYIPSTANSYRYSSCIPISGISVYGDGDQSLLSAIDPNNSAMIINGDHTSLSNVKIISPLSSTIGRQGTPQTAGVWINHASNFVVENASVDTTASVGIISIGGFGTAENPSLISHCSIANTLADGIHLTNQSSYINEFNNTVSNPGDDMFAVVSYTSDDGMCNHIVIADNSGYGQSANGRGISVVGGNTVNILDNTIQKTTAAGIYLQSELDRAGNGSLNYKTYGDDSINVQGNVLNDLASVVHHGGINLGGRAADTTDAGQIESQNMLITNVTISGNTITNSTYSGISMQGYFDHISLENNTIDTTGQEGLEVFGGADIFVGDTGANTFENIGQYGIYVGFNSSIPNLTTGTILIENNLFWNTNVLGTFSRPIISIGSPNVTGSISNNVFDFDSHYQISTPYVRYGVE